MQFKFFIILQLYLNPGTWNSIFTVTGAMAPNVLQWQLVKEVSAVRNNEQVILAQICKLKLEDM